MIPQKSVIKLNDIMMYVAVGVRHFRLMVLLMCLALTMGLFHYCYARPVYYAQCLIKLTVLDSPVNTDTVYHDSNRKILRAQLQSQVLIERTARKFGVYAPYRIITQKYLKKVRIDSDSEGNLKIEIWPYSYEWARDFCETLVKEYIAYRDERRVEQMKLRLAENSSTIDQIRTKLEENLLRKREFGESNELLKVQIRFNQLRDVPVKLAVVKKHLEMMEGVRENLAKITDPVAKLSLLAMLERDALFDSYKDMQLQVGQSIQPQNGTAPVVVVPQDVMAQQKPWENLEKEKRKIEAELAEKSGIYLPGHHEIRTRLKALERVNQALEVEFQAALRTFNLVYDSMVDRQRQLESKLPEYEDIQRRNIQLRQESEMLDAGELNYMSYAKRVGQQLSQMDLGTDKEKTQVDYVGPLEPILDVPISPNPFRAVAISLMLGMALAIGIPFLIAYLDNSVSDIEQVESDLRIQGLGVVPRISDESVNNLLISGANAVPLVKPEYHLQENFRIIRTNLIMHAAGAELPQVILITSAMPQEGKTVVAANLAMSFATKGEKTLLVDGDLRRGRLHRLFGAENKPGLSDVLSGYCQLADACRPSGNENLTIITCGKHLSWASELLDSPVYPRIIDQLRGEYQRIIIDTPPVLGLSETSIMQRFSDGVLMVIWSNRTQMPTVKDAISTLQANGAKFLGFVLNRLDFNVFANRYKYFYYSPRYYTSYKAIKAPVLPESDQSS